MNFREYIGEAKKVTAATIVKLLKNEDEWGDFGSRVFNNKGNLEVNDTFWAGGSEKLAKLKAEWTGNGSYAKYFKDELGVTFTVVGEEIMERPTGKYKKIAGGNNSIIQILLKVN